MCAGAVSVSQPVSYQEVLSHLQGAVSVLSGSGIIFVVQCTVYVHTCISPTVHTIMIETVRLMKFNSLCKCMLDTAGVVYISFTWHNLIS